MREVGRLLALVDQTLGSVFPPERTPPVRGSILANVHSTHEREWLECTVFTPAQYAGEVVDALEQKLLVENCRLRVQPT